MRSHPLVTCFLVLSVIVLGACAPVPQRSAPFQSDPCSELRICRDTMQLLPGDAAGSRTAQTEVVWHGSVPVEPERKSDQNVLSVKIELLTGTLHPLPPITRAISSTDNGVDIELLLDMAPGLLASPREAVRNGNKIWYFDDIFRAVLSKIHMHEGSTNPTQLFVAKPGRRDQSFSLQEAQQFLVEAIPQIAVLDEQTARDYVRWELEDRVQFSKADSGQSIRPRLIVILRLQPTPAVPETYEELGAGNVSGPIRIIILDIGQQIEPNRRIGILRIVSLGAPPAKFDAFDWPSTPDAWTFNIDEIKSVFESELYEALREISVVYDLPELSWPYLITNEQIPNSLFRVTLQKPAQKVTPSCTRVVDFLGHSSIGLVNYFAMNIGVVMLAGMVIVVVYQQRAWLAQWLKSIYRSPRQ